MRYLGLIIPVCIMLVACERNPIQPPQHESSAGIIVITSFSPPNITLKSQDEAALEKALRHSPTAARLIQMRDRLTSWTVSFVTCTPSSRSCEC